LPVAAEIVKFNLSGLLNPTVGLCSLSPVGAHFTGEIIYRSAVHEVHGNQLSSLLASPRLTSGAAPVEMNTPSAASGLTVFFSIVCLPGREIHIISVSKKTGAVISTILSARIFKGSNT
jgi:hypothetical protein